VPPGYGGQAGRADLAVALMLTGETAGSLRKCPFHRVGAAVDLGEAVEGSWMK
jgi:hypothetical protein